MTLAATDTRTLIGVKANQPKFTPLFMALFFPNVIEFSTKEIAFDKIKKGVNLAPFVSPMAGGKPNKKRGGVLKSFMPAYLKPTDVVDPQMVLKRQPGEAMGGELTTVERRDAVKTQLLMEHEESITHREEWMAVQAVCTGQVTVEGEDYETQVVDYGRSAANDIVLAGAAKWDTVDPATYDPADDIQTWAENSSGLIGRLIFHKAAWTKFHSFQAVKDALDTTRAGTTSSLQLGPQANKEVQFKGYYGEFEVWVYAGKYDEDGSQNYFMPDNMLLMAPGSSDGVMAYGAIQDAKANAQGVAAAARWPSNWFTDNPSLEWLQTQSAPLPVMLDADEYVAVTTF